MDIMIVISVIKIKNILWLKKGCWNGKKLIQYLKEIIAKILYFYSHKVIASEFYVWN